MTFLCFSQNLNYAIGWTVVHSLWQAFLITLLVGITLLILQKKTAKVRYFVANLGLWAILTCALATFTFYYDFSKEAGELVFIPDTNTATVDNLLTENATISQAIPSIVENNTHKGLSWAGMKKYCNENMYLIVSLWFMGVVFFLLKILGSISYIFYLRNRMNFPVDEYWQGTLDKLREKLNISPHIELVESALVRSPIVVGHLKPMILFPIGAINRLDSNEVEAILAHELAHVMRQDYIFNILQNVIEALFYYHPAMWWLSSQVRTERENCCDDVAISVCGNAMIYAKSLVSVQEMAYYSPNIAMAFAGTSKKKHLLLRVQRILNQPKSTINIMEKIASTSILFFVLIAFAFGGNRSESINILIRNNIKSTDNQDINNQEKTYLKYTLNGELDSLPVDKHVADGNYSFNNNLYNVDMIVKNQHVTAFKINGLEVNKKDMPKFEKMINELVSAKKEEEDTSSNNSNHFDYQDNGKKRNITAENIDVTHGMATSYLGNGKVTMVDADGTVSELTIDQNGGRFLLIKRKGKGEPLSVSLSDNRKTLMMGGIKSNVAALEKLGWTVTEKGIQPIGGFQNIKPVPTAPNICVPTPPTTPNWSNRLDQLLERSDELSEQGASALHIAEINRKIAEVRRDLTKKSMNYNTIQGKIDDIAGNIDNITAEMDSVEEDNNGSEDNNSNIGYYSSASSHDDGNGGTVRSAEHYDGEHKESTKFDAWLVNELKKDGYLMNTKTYNYAWNNRSMRVVGKTVSDAHRAKYIAMHKKMTGSDLGKSFSITKNVSED